MKFCKSGVHVIHVNLIDVIHEYLEEKRDNVTKNASPTDAQVFVHWN